MTDLRFSALQLPDRIESISSRPVSTFIESGGLKQLLSLVEHEVELKRREAEQPMDSWPFEHIVMAIAGSIQRQLLTNYGIEQHIYRHISARRRIAMLSVAVLRLILRRSEDKPSHIEGSVLFNLKPGEELDRLLADARKLHYSSSGMFAMLAFRQTMTDSIQKREKVVARRYGNTRSASLRSVTYCVKSKVSSPTREGSL